MLKFCPISQLKLGSEIYPSSRTDADADTRVREAFAVTAAKIQ